MQRAQKAEYTKLIAKRQADMKTERKARTAEKKARQQAAPVSAAKV